MHILFTNNNRAVKFPIALFFFSLRLLPKSKLFKFDQTLSLSLHPLCLHILMSPSFNEPNPKKTQKKKKEKKKMILQCL